MFRASWERWPNGWCLTCHAPLEAQQVDLVGHAARPGILQRVVDQGDRWRDGVDCAACHWRDDVLVTARKPTALARSVHAIEQDASLAGNAGCARCHEFRFQTHDVPGRFGQGEGLAQATVSEWRATGEARDCVDCHLAGHGFPGAHVPDLVRKSLVVDVLVDGPDLVFTARAPEAGHRVPTGDPFRRLELRLCPDPDCASSEPVAWFSRTLRRTATSWATADDTRLGREPTTVRVPRGSARAWEVVYRYGERRLEAQLPEVEVGYRLLSGRITPPP